MGSLLQRLSGSLPQAGSTTTPQQATVAPPAGPSGYANDASVGTVPWGIATHGPNQVTNLPAGAQSNNLVGSFPATPIPASATIVGLTLTITGLAQINSNVEILPPILGGLGATASPPGQTIPPTFSDAPMTFGSPSSLAPWGLAGLTAGTWNAAAITVRASVLNNGSGTAGVVALFPFSLTVYYTLPGIAGTVVDIITNGAGRSQGSQTLLPLSTQPLITNPWTILGWSITFEMQLWAASFGAVNGLLGRLYGGLIIGGVVSPETAVPFAAGSLPSDPATIAELWDGGSDATPPWSSGIPGFTVSQNVDTVSQQLPTPLAMAAADKLGIGLWLTPSLGDPTPDGGAVWLAIAAQFAIEYTTG
jgi:hypothetical protein